MYSHSHYVMLLLLPYKAPILKDGGTCIYESAHVCTKIITESNFWTNQVHAKIGLHENLLDTNETNCAIFDILEGVKVDH